VDHRSTKIEIRQEVTTVEIYNDERPPALPAVCAPVSVDQRALAAAVSAHVSTVGRPAVRGDLATGTPQVQAQWIRVQGRGVRVNGTDGFAAKDSVMVLKTVGGVRGVPPRGRPV
jgi:hypothetical protein